MPWGETETGQKRENRPESAILVQTQLAKSPVDGFSLGRLTPRPATRVYEPGPEAGIPMWQNWAASADGLERCVSLGAKRA